MKKIFEILTSAILVAVIGICAFAEDFTPSVTAKPVPDLVPVVLPTGDDFVNQNIIDEKGYPVTAIIVDENNPNNIWGYATVADHTWHALVVTPVSGKDNAVLPEIKTKLENAFEMVKTTNNLDRLTSDNKGLTNYLKENGISADVKDFVVRDLFDITIYGPDKEHLREKLLEHKNITFTFKLGVKASDVVIGMHQPEDATYLADKGMEKGDWEVVPTTNNGDGSVTITLSNLSPVLFAIKTASNGGNGGNGTQSTPAGTHTRNTGDTFNKGIYVVAMVAAASGIVLLSRKRKEEK